MVSPQGQILILEVKAGSVYTNNGLIYKDYSQQKPKDIGQQLGRQHGALKKRLKQANMDHVQVQSFLVLPDHKLLREGLAYLLDRVLASPQMEHFRPLVKIFFVVSENPLNCQVPLNILVV